MPESMWGNNQIAFFLNGEVEIHLGSQVAYGLISLSTTPSTVYVFGYKGEREVVSKIVGKMGVTELSTVIDNSNSKILGSVSSYISQQPSPHFSNSSHPS